MSNIEKRFINGKEISIKPKQPLNIQNKINQKNIYTGDLSELTSSEPINKIYDNLVSEFAEGFGKDQFFSISGSPVDQDAQRRSEYSTYREMWNQIFIQNALHVIKNESSQTNEEGNRIKIISDNQDIIDDGNELFFDILDINYTIKNVISETCQMGDNFYELILDNYEKPKTIIHMEWLEPSKIRKIMENGRLKYYLYIDTDSLENNKNENGLNDYLSINNFKEEKIKNYVKIFMPWQIVHFRIKDQSTEPYGRSLFKAGIKDFRRLSLLEDSMLVYRISRSVERRIFYIDVGQMNTREVMVYMNKIKNIFKKEPIIDDSGKISERANVMSTMEDFFIPKRENQTGTQIQTLPAGIALNEIKDIEYFKDKLLRLLNIPLTYIGGSSETGASDQSRTLSAQDIKFSNFVEEIQQHIAKGLNKIFSLQLILKGYKNDEVRNFKIELTKPSSINQLIQLELLDKQVGLAANYKSSQMFSDEWIYKNIFRMSIKEMYQEQVRLNSQLQKQMSMAQGFQQGAGMGTGLSSTGSETGLPPPIESETGLPPPTDGTELTPPEQTVQPELASFNLNNMIYKLGLQSLYENSEELLVKNINEVLGESFLIQNNKDIAKLINETTKIKNMLEKDEEEINKKKKQKNDYKRMCIEGEFEGIDINGNKSIKYYKNGREEKVIKNEKNKRR